ncbi:MAG: hypothetical protein LBQ79_06910 [Deltaproteobacteria bacterium]|jgi:transposase|nr:hypothetical protein [Deltaproteobacteria bacterium]
MRVNTVRKWRRRFMEHGLDWLKDDPRFGRTVTYEHDALKAYNLGCIGERSN